MRFTQRMIGERGAVVTLVQQGLLTQVDAGAQLELTDCQVRRLVRRVEPAGSDLQALVYQRLQPAPNRLPGHVHAAVGALAAERRLSIWTLLPSMIFSGRRRGLFSGLCPS